MARKMNSEEEQLFAEALRSEKSPAEDAASEQFLQRFSEKRDSPLRLTPELAAWLSEGPLGPVVS
jgi:hypothetical protein